MSCLSICMEQIGYHWTDFHETWYLRIFLKYVEKIEVTSKSHKENGYSACRPIYIYDNRLINTAVQLLIQSFGLLNHLFPSFFYPGQGSSNLAHSLSVNLFWHQPPNVTLVFPLDSLIWGFQECIALTILISCILSIWPYHPIFCSLAKFIMFLCFIILSNSWLVLFAILHSHNLGHIFFSKLSFQRPLIYLLLFLLISMFRMHM